MRMSAVELLPSPFEPHFRRFLESGERRLILCTPYVSRRPLAELAECIGGEVSVAYDVHIITDLSARHLLSGSTDVQALADTVEALSGATVTYVPKVHAKVYVAGESLAIVGSANFTEGGASGNLEYGVALSDAGAIRQIRTDIQRYAALGGTVSARALRRLAGRTLELRQAVQQAQDTANVRLERAARQLERETEDELIRLHVAGRSPHAVFAEGVLYFLSFGAMSTRQLHDRLARTFPDLCDDTLDRVIDGEHFGKLWKHQVRTAQQHLKRRGLISYEASTRLWRLTQ